MSKPALLCLCPNLPPALPLGSHSPPLRSSQLPHLLIEVKGGRSGLSSGTEIPLELGASLDSSKGGYLVAGQSGEGEGRERVLQAGKDPIQSSH